MSAGRIVIEAGKVLVRSEDMLWSEPTLAVEYRALDCSDWGVTEGETATPHHSDAGLCVLGTHAGPLRVCRYVNGKKNIPERVEYTAIAPPRVRAGTQTRWHQGHWQKTTRRGWVNA